MTWTRGAFTLFPENTVRSVEWQKSCNMTYDPCRKVHHSNSTPTVIYINLQHADTIQKHIQGKTKTDIREASKIAKTKYVLVCRFWIPWNKLCKIFRNVNLNFHYNNSNFVNTVGSEKWILGNINYICTTTLQEIELIQRRFA